MKIFLSNIKIEIPLSFHIKALKILVLGEKILENGIKLIENIGFERFNIKELRKLISTSESAIYKCFESKHKLLNNLTSRHWEWIQYRLAIETKISDSKEKLTTPIQIATKITEQDSNLSHINEVILNMIVISENSKSQSTKELDTENKEGFFKLYKGVVERLAQIIMNYNNTYQYTLTLTSTVIEGTYITPTIYKTSF